MIRRFVYKGCEYQFRDNICIGFMEDGKIRDVNTIPTGTKITKTIINNLKEMGFIEKLEKVDT